MDLFGVSFNTWKNVCKMYFSLSKGSLQAYLQWFPFTKLSSDDKKIIASEDFYNKYIKNASIVLFSRATHQTENFLQKGDGSFRNASLISPALYLLLQAIAKEIHAHYVPVRSLDISVYYAGNYENMRPKYKKDYDDFFKELNSCIDEYQYFIKTDITNFFSNISVDKLIMQIDKICNRKEVVFSQAQLYLIKELLTFCGNGRFPLIENSVASSYLATIIYLDEIDLKIYNYINERIPYISSFKIVRYVDDMYILIASDEPSKRLNDAYNEIRNEYSSILKEYGLALNTKKCCLKRVKEISQELKKSIYDEYYNGEKHNIEDLFNGALLNFLNDLSKELLQDSIDNDKYNLLVSKHFSSDDIEFTPSEVFNYFVYENECELLSAPVADRILELVKKSISFISLDPKRLTIMIMKTKNDKAIKAFLNKLFSRDRADKWNSYDTEIAISYLIQRKFVHSDLLKILHRRHPELYKYYHYNCKGSFINCFGSPNIDKLVDAISTDNKAYFIYFMYLSEVKKGNHMAAFAYYKNYFDRVTSDLQFAFCREEKQKKPNYKKYYSESVIKNFYNEIEGSDEIIAKAHKLRNSNPISHSSSELIDKGYNSNELLSCINDLSSLIDKYLLLHKI